MSLDVHDQPPHDIQLQPTTPATVGGRSGNYNNQAHRPHGAAPGRPPRRRRPPSTSCSGPRPGCPTLAGTCAVTPVGCCVVSGFVDECQINVRGGDGGAGCVAVRREAHVAKGGPDGGDGGKGGDVWLVADRNVASLLAFRTTRTAGPPSGTHGSGKKKHGAGGDDLDGARPRGHRGARPRRHGARRPRATRATAGWPPPAAGAARATPGSSPTSAGPRCSPSRARTARSAGCSLELKLMADVALVGLPQRGQVHPDLAGLGGQAQDRRLPLHHPRAQPRRGAPRRRLRVRRRRHPRPHRGRQRGQGPRPPVPAPHRAGPGPGAAARPRRRRRRHHRRPAEQARRAARRAGGLPARPARPAPARRRLPGRHGPSTRAPTGAERASPTTASSSTCASRRSPATACPAWWAAWPTSSARPARPSPSPRASSSTGPSPEGFAHRARRRRQLPRDRPRRPSGPSPSPTSPTSRRSTTPTSRLKKLGVDKALARPAPARATSCASVELELRRTRRTDATGGSSWPRSARRRSPTTPGEIDATPSPSSAPRSPALRAAGHRVVVVTSRRHRRRACPRSAWAATSAPRRRHPAGRLGRRPEPPDGRLRRRARPPRPGGRPGAARPARLRRCASQYLQARGTLLRLLELGVVPVVNENDAIADDEIRFGDNDRIAALVAHLVDADLLVLLTDTARPAHGRPPPRPVGVAHRGDRRDRPEPRGRRRRRRHAPGAAAAWPPRWRRPRSPPGRACARSSPRPSAPTCSPTPWPATPGVGTVVQPHDRDLPARKLWIAFAVGSAGHGRRRRRRPARRSSAAACRCCRPGSVGSRASFDADDAVEISDTDGVVFAKGLVRVVLGGGRRHGRAAQRRPARRRAPLPRARRRPRPPALSRRPGRAGATGTGVSPASAPAARGGAPRSGPASPGRWSCPRARPPRGPARPGSPACRRP